EKIGADMWQLLSDSISSKKKHLAGRLLICDSKKAYTPSTGKKIILTAFFISALNQAYRNYTNYKRQKHQNIR
ncbi:MAG: hypothetical protein KKE40_05920, partial [Planctomycetes bacterium]|nr:hypothetical protein [Planctomycetota bacterium]